MNYTPINLPFAKLAKAFGWTGKGAVRIERIGKSAFGMNLSWAAVENFSDLITNDKINFVNFLEDAIGIIPFVGSANEIRKLLIDKGYKVSVTNNR